jgi:DNA-binding NarL/FixJ family response regulator
LVQAGLLDKGNKQANGQPPVLAKLTTREREVIQLITEGKSSKEVAAMGFRSFGA